MMIRNLKALSLVLAAALSMGAVSASAASAAEFHSSSVSTTISAGQTTQHKLTVNLGSLICSEASFSGTQVGTTASTVSIAPFYNGCEFEGLFGLTVNTNGCDYVFHASSATEGTVDISACGTNKFIQLGNLGFCRVRFPEQAGLGPITYTQQGNDVLVIANISNLTYEESGLICPGPGGTNGVYVGSSLAQGNGGAATIFVE